MIEIEDHIVVVRRTWAHGNCVETELVTNLPCDHVVRAGGVATQAKATNDPAIGSVERKTAREDDDAADGFTHHGILWRSKGSGIAERSLRVGRLTGGQ